MSQKLPRPVVPVKRPRTPLHPEPTPWLFVYCLLVLFGTPTLVRILIDTLS